VSTEIRAFCAALLLAACADDDGMPDGGPLPDAIGAELLIGTGGIDCYLPLEDGDVAYLARGCQGSQHVWISLRARGLDLRSPLIQMRGVRASDASDEIGPVVQTRLTFDPIEGEDWFALDGMRILVPEPDAVAGEEVVLGVRVRENRSPGITVEREKRVTLEWGPETCGGPTLCDPTGGTDAGRDGGLDASSSDAGPDAARDE
jgi:hypothetical protein